MDNTNEPLDEQSVNHIDLGAKLKELLSEKDPTIDWSKIFIEPIGEGSIVGLGSEDPTMKSQILQALELMTGQKMDSLPIDPDQLINDEPSS